jgi:hypothetical protein
MPNNIYNQNGHKAEFTFLPSDDKFLDSLSGVSCIWLIEGLDTSVLIRYYSEGGQVKEFRGDRIFEYNRELLSAEFYDNENGGERGDTLYELPISMIERVILYIQ